MNGIWIRSQDKTVLVWADKFDVCMGDIYAKGEYGDVTGNSETLGRYESNERALEVLNEIQAAIIGSTHRVYSSPPSPALSFYNVTTVYQMPAE